MGTRLPIACVVRQEATLLRFWTCERVAVPTSNSDNFRGGEAECRVPPLNVPLRNTTALGFISFADHSDSSLGNVCSSIVTVIMFFLRSFAFTGPTAIE